MTLPKMVLVSKGSPHPSQLMSVCRLHLICTGLPLRGLIIRGQGVCVLMRANVLPHGSSVRILQQEHWSRAATSSSRDFPTAGSNPCLLHCGQDFTAELLGSPPRCEPVANAPTICRDWFFQNLLSSGKVCAFLPPLSLMIVWGLLPLGRRS